MTNFHSNNFVDKRITKYNISEAFVGVNMTEEIAEHFRKYDDADSYVGSYTLRPGNLLK